MLHVTLKTRPLAGAVCRFATGAGLAAAIALCLPDDAGAHGFAGNRFFPATLAIEDPFVADELSLPTFKRPPTESDGTFEYEFEVEFTKRITPNLAIGAEYGWVKAHPPGARSVFGGESLTTNIAYQLFVDPEREMLGVAGLGVNWAHTGRVHALEAPDFTTLSPSLGFGKGFGDLPDSMTLLRPIAVTSNFSLDFPTKTQSAGEPHPNFFNYGFAFEYSLEYLQHHVKDVGLKPPFDRLIPLVELSFTTGLNRGARGNTTGTVQPGIIWAGQHFQIGAEAIIPINGGSGKGLGAIVQLHFYLDDLFPKTLGKPLLQW